MQRVMIIGQPGSGKSTFAQALGQAAGLKVVHLDKVHWKPGWTPRPMAEKLPLVAAAEAEDCWIIEGGLSQTWANRLERADSLIWLDRPLGLRLWRVLARLWRYRGRTRADLTDGCEERFGRETVEFIWYILRTRNSGRAAMARLYSEAKAAGKQTAHLQRDATVHDWLAQKGAKPHTDWGERRGMAS